MTLEAIDDSMDVLRLIKTRLRGESLELECTSDGAHGIERARQAKPALILLDIEMPGMDGFEILRTLKEDPATLATPVIMLSGLTSAQDKVTAFELGAIDYVTKPFDFAELRVRIRSALRTHALLQMLAQRAQIDGLTGLWNRTYFDRRLVEELAGCARHGRPLSLAMLDIDRFKLINDTFGHPAGDAVLTGVSSLIRREIRDSDLACRFGGEEFTLIMPDTLPGDAAVLCERIRTTLENVVWPRHPDHVVSISIGLVGSTQCGSHPPEFWLEAADRNLYRAKTTGRNQTVWSELQGAGIAVRTAG
jgi:diguanylate cyclase (GGDEF)-like protein